MPRDDINYKVAISEGAKQLEAGQLKKAESQFRLAVKRCADCAGGYRGLAKVFIELDDRTTALEILRDGAQSLARSNNRAEALELLRDAVRLAPEDRTLHRRYAAALANAGHDADAVAEYGRFVSLALERNDLERARLEVEYARETLGNASGVEALADRLTRPGASRDGTAPPMETAAAAIVDPTPDAKIAHQPFEDLVKGAPPDPRQRALALEARAHDLVLRRDAAATVAALEAARALMGEGLQHAAADLLLQLVATGVTDRDAQRLLVDVARSLGRGEIARDKCALLAHALRLDGRADAATEVERLAAV
jgi:thioredoxin-like negative regulator of GroEL